MLVYLHHLMQFEFYSICLHAHLFDDVNVCRIGCNLLRACSKLFKKQMTVREVHITQNIFTVFNIQAHI
jgi:hypothetical protein